MDEHPSRSSHSEGMPEDEARDLGMTVSGWMREHLTQDPETGLPGELPPDAEAVLRQRRIDQARRSFLRLSRESVVDASQFANAEQYRQWANDYLDNLALDMGEIKDPTNSASEVVEIIRAMYAANKQFPNGLPADDQSVAAGSRVIAAIQTQLSSGELPPSAEADYLDALGLVIDTTTKDDRKLAAEISARPLDVLSQLLPRDSPAGARAFKSLPRLFNIRNEPEELAETGAKLALPMARRLDAMARSTAIEDLITEIGYIRDLSMLINTNPSTLRMAESQGMDRQAVADELVEAFKKTKSTDPSHTATIAAINTLRTWYEPVEGSAPEIPETLVPYLREL